MPTVHPSFDPSTSTWFVGNIEAPSIRALKGLLPSRTKIEGYYPNGYTAIRPNSTEQRIYLPIKSSFHLQKHKEPPKPKPEPKSQTYFTYTHDMVLDDWAAGMTGDAIAIKYNIAETRHVIRIVIKARDAGDPRAAPHFKPGVKIERKKKFNHDEILDLWAAGLSGPEIGKRLGLTRSTTAGGVVALYRKKGDPRAIARSDNGDKISAGRKKRNNMNRIRLPNRRFSQTLNFEVSGQKYIATVGFFDNGHLAELFINSSGKLGSTADVNAADGALAVSLALQYGCPVDILQKGMKRNSDGSAQGPLGAALDAIFKI